MAAATFEEFHVLCQSLGLDYIIGKTDGGNFSVDVVEKGVGTVYQFTLEIPPQTSLGDAVGYLTTASPASRCQCRCT